MGKAQNQARRVKKTMPPGKKSGNGLCPCNIRHLPRLSNKFQILHLFVGSLAMALIAPFTQPGVGLALTSPFQFACKSICLNESSLSYFLKLGKQASIIKPRTTFLEAEAFNALNTRQFSPQLLKRPCQIKSH